MSTYKIVSATKSGDAPHDHVVGISIGPSKDLTIAEVRERMDHAHTFYVFGGDQPSVVEPLDCDCGAKTIKSGAGATEHNDLDSLPSSI